MDREYVELIVVAVLIPLLAYVQEQGFENLVSRPFFERWLKPLKPYQSFIVALVGIGLSFLCRQVGIDLVPDIGPFVNAQGDVVTVLVGLVISVLSMAMHVPTRQRDPNSVYG